MQVPIRRSVAEGSSLARWVGVGPSLHASGYDDRFARPADEEGIEEKLLLLVEEQVPVERFVRGQKVFEDQPNHGLGLIDVGKRGRGLLQSGELFAEPVGQLIGGNLATRRAPAGFEPGGGVVQAGEKGRFGGTFGEIRIAEDPFGGDRRGCASIAPRHGLGNLYCHQGGDSSLTGIRSALRQELRGRTPPS